MTRDAIEHLLRAAAALTNERDFIVIGSPGGVRRREVTDVSREPRALWLDGLRRVRQRLVYGSLRWGLDESTNRSKKSRFTSLHRFFDSPRAKRGLPTAPCTRDR